MCVCVWLISACHCFVFRPPGHPVHSNSPPYATLHYAVWWCGVSVRAVYAVRCFGSRGAVFRDAGGARGACSAVFRDTPICLLTSLA